VSFRVHLSVRVEPEPNDGISSYGSIHVGSAVSIVVDTLREASDVFESIVELVEERRGSVVGKNAVYPADGEA
jgi:hypothetical protein